MMSLPDWKYQRLFTAFLTDDIKKFKSSSPNRWLINDPHRMRAVADWNNMKASLVCLFNDNKFPHNMYDFTFSYSLLKLDPNLDCAQQAHCDQDILYSIGTEKNNFFCYCRY